MSYRIVVLLGLVGTMGLAGCGGSGGNSFADAFNARVAAHNALLDFVNSKPNTSFVGMPVAGSATYNGYAIVKYNNGTIRDTQLSGDAQITADFAAGTIGGQATNFQGWHNDGPLGSYTGTVTLSGGVIGVNRPNDLGAFIGGTLVQGPDTIVISGGMLGDFKGTPIIGAVTSLDAQSTMTINGGAPLPITGGFVVQR